MKQDRAVALLAARVDRVTESRSESDTTTAAASILPIGVPEKAMFDAIDRRRTIEEISDVAGGDDASRRGRAFFENLWRYDQVTFDASTAQRAKVSDATQGFAQPRRTSWRKNLRENRAT